MLLMGDRLSERLGIFLLKKGFTIKSLSRCCFDIIARKGSRILLIKVLSDANAISDEYAEQMKSISSYMQASPFIVAETAGHDLQDNVVYSRYGVYTLSFSTFRNSIDNKLPYISSTKAGLTARIAGQRFRQSVDDAGISSSDLSRKIGVSRRMVSNYENGSQVTMQKAEKIYDIFGHSVFEKIDLFSQHPAVQLPGSSAKETLITRKYSELGFDAAEARKVPFNIIARKDEEIILTGIGDKVNPNTTSVSRLLDAENLVIFNSKRPKEKNIPSLTKQEFMEFEESDELMKFLKEY
ncbi:helix-turn-helix domain-containing protein [Candidatus Woesearchaeota archaeon]|nr:helix-turn-helix domain-containing protein [Candidatus Woesearchaeota archaeon]